MKKLDVILHFNINENFENINSIKELIDFMIDNTWDEFYKVGLEPPKFEIKIKE